MFFTSEARAIIEKGEGCGVSYLKISVYVESVRRAVRTDQVAREFYRVDPLTTPQSGAERMAGGHHVIQEHRVETVTRFKVSLPDEQMRFVEMVESFASEHGFELEVVDIGRKNRLERWIQEKIKGIETYPMLVTDRGHRIEGNITREQLESLLPTA
jgi:glutaredoxin